MSDLLARVLTAHGGLARWQRVSRLRLDLDIRGNVLLTKFKSPRWRHYLCTVKARELEVVFHDYPSAGNRGVYQGGRVLVETTRGQLLKERGMQSGADGRVPFRWAWDDLDLLFFFGYAVWNYALSPFLLAQPGFLVTELPPWPNTARGPFERLQVRFPDHIPTHSREQIFYFNRQGLMVRLDYTAEVFGPWARGAHFCSGHREYDGIVFPTRRRVFGGWVARYPLPFLTAMEGRIRRAALE